METVTSVSFSPIVLSLPLPLSLSLSSTLSVSLSVFLSLCLEPSLLVVFDNVE